ncbi:MAG: thiopeptide-type bacteriocin biosynthesis protein [Candidatus Delongbacteria bacterium]|nr:thiopeptide-type bacteriocin biosynthesis protein [Candidatus Delongbacteria bacterium]MDD4205812.1 thiopeptide-type bacteriocin biosynthesis protein [Candidatus Delongbacteria bacterium]
MKREFHIGSEWLFYKIYCGYKSADTVLTEAIKPVLEKLFSDKVIVKWFFIRYGDPDLHIRLRFHFTEKESAGIIIKNMYDALDDLIQNGIVSKVVIDVYEREINRYGENTIEISESIFGIDSSMILNLINFISDKGDRSEHIRWRFGLRAIDRLLTDFGMDLSEKIETIVKFRDGFNKEFSVEKYLKKQLNDNYREMRKDIEVLMKAGSDYEYTPIFNDLLDFKSNMTRPLISELNDPESTNSLRIDRTGYIASLSHMMLNRLFRSNQRPQEMVLYNYLWKYYDSMLARMKHTENNKQQELKEVTVG